MRKCSAKASSTYRIESDHCSYFRNFSGRYGITLSLYSCCYYFFLLSSFRSLFGRHSLKWNIIWYPYRNKKVFDVRPIVDHHLNIFKRLIELFYFVIQCSVFTAGPWVLYVTLIIIIIIHTTTHHNIFIWNTYIHKMYWRTATIDFLH